MSRLRDLTGRTFGQLTAVERVFPNASGGQARWKFKCTCGVFKELTGSDVVKGSTISCGHLQVQLRQTYQKGNTGSKNGKWKGHEEISGHFWGTIKNNAKVRHTEFSISIEDAWLLFLAQDKKCALSGLPIHFNTNVRSTKGTASVDRIDSKQSYTLDNVQWVHKHINRMKQNFSEEYFLNLCKAVAHNA